MNSLPLLTIIVPFLLGLALLYGAVRGQAAKAPLSDEDSDRHGG